MDKPEDELPQAAEQKQPQPAGLELMRTPFPPHQISKLPKPTKQQTDEVKRDFTKGVRCQICGGWHHPKVVHVDYVGHAALTSRLLDCDPAWNWEPLATDGHGFPAIDNNGGMWIKLTVCGVTRLGYGDAQGKDGGDAMKERIGDALRNAAMRFGSALDLWHKGSLDDPGEDAPAEAPPAKPPYQAGKFAENLPKWQALIEAGKRTPDDIIRAVTTSAVMSIDQVSAIRALGGAK